MDGVTRVVVDGFVYYSMTGMDGLVRTISLPLENDERHGDEALKMLKSATDDLVPLREVH